MQYTLVQGSHPRFIPDNCCAMELVAHLAGERHSDRPQCTHAVIAEYARTLNDLMSTKARDKLLKPVILSGVLAGTRGKDDRALARLVRQRVIGENPSWCLADACLRETQRSLSIAHRAAKCYASHARNSDNPEAVWKQAVKLLEDLCNYNSEK